MPAGGGQAGGGLAGWHHTCGPRIPRKKAWKTPPQGLGITLGQVPHSVVHRLPAGTTLSVWVPRKGARYHA